MSRFNAFILTLLVFGFSAEPIRAQYMELGVNGGGSNFLGDVGNYGPSAPTGWHAGAFFRYNFNRYYALSAGANFGTVAADDANSSETWRNARNLNFRTNLWEAYLQLEFNFFEYEPGTKFDHTPYLFGGFALFGFNPQGQVPGTDDWVDLQPLGTEGQGTGLSGATAYGTTSLSIPFGMGYKWALGRSFTLQVYSGFRSTRTDYLDDVSGRYVDPVRLEQINGTLAAAMMDKSGVGASREGTYRGNPDNNDWYIFTGFALVWELTQYKENCKTW